MTFSHIPKGIIAIGASLLMVLGQTPLVGSVAAVGSIGAEPSASSTSGRTISALAILSTWTSTITLEPATHAWGLADLSAAGGAVAAAWVEQDATTTWLNSVWVRESLNSGTTWQPAVRLASNASMPADHISLTSDAASGKHFAVWEEGSPGGQLRIVMSEKTFGSTPWTTPSQVSENTSTTDAWYPSIVVTPAYYFVTYTRTSANGSNATARLRIFNRNTGIWAPSINLGPTGGIGGVERLAAASNKVAMVWSNSSGVVKLRRGTFGNGSSPVISWSTSSLGSGRAPFIVLSGTRGVVGWVESSDVYIRRTTNGGATWSAATKVLNGSASNAYGVSDAAMSGLNVVFAGSGGGSCCADPLAGYGFRMTSSNGGLTWTKTTSYPHNGDNRQVAYTTKPSSGGLKTVAEAWQNSTYTSFPWKVMYHRQT